MKGNILLVDDDEMSSQILSFILTDEGYEVDLAATGAAGVEMVSAKSYDVVFLDFYLPDMKGFDAASKMKKISPSTKIVLLTGYAKSGEDQIGNDYDRVLLKPVSPEVIIKTITEILGQPIAKEN